MVIIMSAYSFMRVREWLKRMKNELGARDLILIDKRGFVISYYSESGKSIHALLKLIGNYTLSMDLYINQILSEDVSYALIETKKSIFISYRFTVDNDLFYMIMIFRNHELPIGIILMRLDAIKNEFKDIYRGWNKAGEKESDNVTAASDNISEEDLNEMLKKMENHPLFKSIIKNINNVDKEGGG